VLPASLLLFGLAALASPANAAPVLGTPFPGVTTSTTSIMSTTSGAQRAVQLVAPQLTARTVVAPTKKTPASVDRAALVLRRAAALAGRPYHYGGVGPRSFDCSGFTRYVFATAVGRSLPHSSSAQYRLSHKIAKSAIRPGDLVFFVSRGHVYHVGIYAGHGLIWHAPHSGDHVRLAKISTSSWVAGRVL